VIGLCYFPPNHTSHLFFHPPISMVPTFSPPFFLPISMVPIFSPPSFLFDMIPLRHRQRSQSALPPILLMFRPPPTSQQPTTIDTPRGSLPTHARSRSRQPSLDTLLPPFRGSLPTQTRRYYCTSGKDATRINRGPLPPPREKRGSRKPCPPPATSTQ
jgi:hypothetical protein